MKRILSAAAGICFALGLASAATAQDATHSETTTKQTGPGANTKVKQETVTGTVKEYEPGKEIEIIGPGDKVYTFDLDQASRVEGAIAVGQSAKVLYRKGDDGRETVVVLSAGGPRTGVSAAPPAPRAYSESTVKQTGPGPNAKAKTEVVIGTVKDFEPGKSIKVVGPGDKDYSFDLDDATAMSAAAVTVGQRVKVTYTKTSTGGKVVSIEPHTGS